MPDAEPVELRDRAQDRGIAVIDVVGQPDGGNAGGPECRAGDLRVGEEAFLFDRVPVGRLVQNAFEVGEDEIGGAQFVADPGERHGGVVHVHQVHIADQDHRGHLEFSPVRTYIC